MKVNHGDYCHELLAKNTRAKLHYDVQTDYKKWTENVREKFIELFGLDKIKQNASELNLKIDSVKDYGDYTLTEFCFDSELGATVPCYLLVPNSGKEKYEAGDKKYRRRCKEESYYRCSWQQIFASKRPH